MPRALLFILAFLTHTGSFAGADSTKTEKGGRPPKHYMSNCVYTNYYSNQARDLRPSLNLNKPLTTYSYTEINSGFYLPFFTRDYYRDDSTRIANIHWLFVGNFLTAKPHFGGLEEQHDLYKTSLGIRFFYNNGKKNIWFFNGTPLVAKDKYSVTTAKYASVLVFNRTVNEKFSYRLGFTKTFIFGNRYHLPLIGFRCGALDGVYVSIMIPRSFSVNFPIGRKCSASLFVKPIGGLYDFSNRDSIYAGDDQVLQFGRYEFLNGVRFDCNLSKHFSFFLSGGSTRYNAVSFGAPSFQNNKKGLIAPFYIQKNLEPALFINWGLTLRFGKTKKVYNNMNMYDIFELNNTFDPGDNNTGPGNGDIPPKGSMKAFKKIQYKDVQDLVELEDLY